MKSRHTDNINKAEQAKRDLRRVAGEADTLGTSATARMATKIESRFKADDVDQSDPIEVWGARIGRGLGLIAFIGLAIYLFITYVLN